MFAFRRGVFGSRWAGLGVIPALLVSEPGMAASASGSCPSVTVYVSPNGSDEQNGTDAQAGTSGRPVLSIGRALGLAQDKRCPARGRCTNQSGFRVIVEPGVYPLTESLRVLPAHSGTQDCPTQIIGNVDRVQPAAEVVVSGAFSIQRRVISLVDAARREYRFPVPEDLLDIDGELPADLRINQLFVNKTRRFRPRWPKGDYATTVERSSRGEDKRQHWLDSALPIPAVKLGFTELVLFHSWNATHHVVKAVDSTRKVVDFESHSIFALKPNGGQRYYLEDVVRDLEPGEWSQGWDRVNNKRTSFIRYRAILNEDGTDDLQNANFAIHIPDPRVTRLLDFAGAANRRVEYVEINGLTFRYAAGAAEDFSRGADRLSNTTRTSPNGVYKGFEAAIYGDHVDNVTIEKCEVSAVGEHGIRFLGDTSKLTILENHIHDLGSGGILIGDTTPMSTTFNQSYGLRSSPAAAVADNVLIKGNLIHDGSRIYPSGTGIVIGHAKNIEVRFNRIANFNYSGIAMGRVTGFVPFVNDSNNAPRLNEGTVVQNTDLSFDSLKAKRPEDFENYKDIKDQPVNENNRIIGNHISNIGNRVLSDGAGIYLLGQSPNTRVEGNWIHHCAAYRTTSKISGIYMDEGSSGITVVNNVVSDTEQSAFTFHYGVGNLIERNLFLRPGWDPIQIVRSYDRAGNFFGKDYLGEDYLHKANTVKQSTLVFKKNIVILGQGTFPGERRIRYFSDFMPRFCDQGRKLDTPPPEGKPSNLNTIRNLDHEKRARIAPECSRHFRFVQNIYSTENSNSDAKLSMFGTPLRTWLSSPLRDPGSVYSPLADLGMVTSTVDGWVSVAHDPYGVVPTTKPGIQSGWLQPRSFQLKPRGLGRRKPDAFADEADLEP